MRPTWGALAYALWAGICFLSGLVLGRFIERQARERGDLAKLHKNRARVDELIAIAAARGWIEQDEFRELVAIWHGFADFACHVRRPWEPAPSRWPDAAPKQERPN